MAALLRLSSQCIQRSASVRLLHVQRRSQSRAFLACTPAVAHSRPFSLQARLAEDRQSEQKHKKAGGSQPLPELPGFSLDSLGLTPRMRTALIVLLCIFGTIETFTWTMFFYNRFWKKEEMDEELEDEA